MIRWTEALAIDQGVIDQDHRWLIGLVNELETDIAIPFDALHEMVFQIQLYTEIHFTREEELQRQVGFPENIAHAAEHRSLKGKVATLHKRLHDQSEPSARLAVQAELYGLLEDWFLRHIQCHDVALRPYAEELRQHGANLPALENASPS